MKTKGYFDYAAATPLDPRVAEQMQPYLTEHFGNPSSLHKKGKAMRLALEAARSSVALRLGTKKTEIIFTSSSTEAAFIAISGIAEEFPKGSVVTSAIEHPAVLAPLYEGFGAAQVRQIGVDAAGIVKVDDVVDAVDDSTVLICLQYANNEIGTLQPVAKIASQVARIRRDRERDKGLPLFLYCDAAQAGLLSLQVSRLGVDMLSMGGSKLYGPSGSGFLYIRTGIMLKAPMPGGGQESGLRGGTENVPAAIGLSAALKLVQDARGSEIKRLASLRDLLWSEISDKITGLTMNGSREHRLPGNLHISIQGCGGEDLVAYLDSAGFAVATGSACSAAHQGPSHVLLALGLTMEAAESSLRITLGRFTQVTDVNALVKALETAVHSIRRNSAKNPHQVQ